MVLPEYSPIVLLAISPDTQEEGLSALGSVLFLIPGFTVGIPPHPDCGPCSTSRTGLGRGRAWLYLALMQKKLADYLRVLVENRHLLG